MQHNDSFWMRKAIDCAKVGGSRFGCVITDTHGNHVAAYNTTRQVNATAHAEMNALQKIRELTYDKGAELTLYTTVEPCPMCMGAIVWSGIGKVRYGISIEHVSQYIKQIMIPSEHIARNSWRDIQIDGGIELEACLELWKK